MIKELTALADALDKKGFFVEANELDCIIRQAWFPMTKEELIEKETIVRERLREQGLDEEEIEYRLDLIFPERIDIEATLKVADQNDGQTVLEDIMEDKQDPRVIPGPDGGHICSICGTHIPESEIQLGCRYCEEGMNLGFVKDPHGPLSPPRLKNSPRLYDRYRQEPPERIDIVRKHKEDTEHHPYSDIPY